MSVSDKQTYDWDIGHHPGGEEIPADNNEPRERVLTEKGLEYQLKTLSDSRTKLYRRLEKRSKDITDHLQLLDQQPIQEYLQQYNETATLFEQTHTRYNQLLSPDEREEDEKWYNTVDEQIHATKQLAYSCLRTLREQDDAKSIRSKRSSRSSRSSKSDRSGSSRRSTALSMKEKLINEKLKMAELLVVPAHTEQPLQLEVDASKSRGNVNQMIKTSAPPQSNIDSTTNDASTNQILCTMLKQQLAPSMDLEVFDGNPLNFNYFLATF